MKLSVWILCVCCWLGCALSCGGEVSPSGIERAVAALSSDYNTPVPFPNGLGNVPPSPQNPHGNNPLAAGQEWWVNYNGGWTNHQVVNGGLYRTAGNVGWTWRQSILIQWNDPPVNGIGIQNAPVDHAGFPFPGDNLHLGARQVMLSVWDRRFPFNASSVNINAEAFQLPLRGVAAPQTPTALQGQIWYMADAANVYGSPADDHDAHINSTIFQVSGLLLDPYGRCEFCSGANMTGSCNWFGYNCPSPVCHGDPGVNPDFNDIRWATGDANGNQYTHLSGKCEFGFVPAVHGPPAAGVPHLP